MEFNQIMSAIVTVLCAVITTVLVPYLRAKLSEKQQSTIKELIEIAVNAAEQIFCNEEKSGVQKSLFVIDFLKDQNIVTDNGTVPQYISNMIESAVFAVNAKRKGE